MGDYDEYDNDWGYNGDAEHDMWVDYTTDMYEGSDYSGENPDCDDCDMDWDAEYESNVDCHNDATQQYTHRSHCHNRCSADPATVRHYEDRIHKLEGIIAAAIASAATLNKKSANSSSAKNIRKYQRRATAKQSEAKYYQAKLDKLKVKYKTEKLELEKTRTLMITVICAVVSFIAIIMAILY